METRLTNRFVLIFVTLLAMLAACGTPSQAPVSQAVDTRCIQGTAWYKSPLDGSQVRYPKVKVAAWRLDAEKPLIEAQTDQNGDYCMEVPYGDYDVAVRVWGTLPVLRKTYLCNGSQEGIDLKASGKKCGGECMKVDIFTECKEFVPSKHRRY